MDVNATATAISTSIGEVTSASAQVFGAVIALMLAFLAFKYVKKLVTRA